jgi:hypothetical protein
MPTHYLTLDIAQNSLFGILDKDNGSLGVITILVFTLILEEKKSHGIKS